MSPPLEIRFPDDQQEGTEASVARWLVQAGAVVAAHEPIVEIETDKVVVEVATPRAGRLSKILIGENQAVKPGELLATLDCSQTGAEAAGSQPTADQKLKDSVSKSSATLDTHNTRLSPAVRQRVMQHKLDIAGLCGSGRGGRITLGDIERLIPPSKAVTAGQSTTSAQAAATTSATASAKGSEIIPHDKMRKRIADNMVTSLLHTAPHVTAVFEVDLSAVMRHRKANRESFARRGTPLTLTVYFIAASVNAIQKVPQVNSRWFTDHLEIFEHINIGIGTALGDGGLIVPVLHDAQGMDLAEIAAELADLTTRARDRQLKPEDVRGGTFTISNHGVSGSLLAAPIIINQPQSAILGVGKIEKRIKIREIDGQDTISIRPMCYVSLTVDHRVVDGHQTNAFLTELVDTLENWS